MRRIILVLTFIFLTGALVFAQDPGIQDSVIVSSDVYYINSENPVLPDTFLVNVNISTDDSVFFMNLPLKFESNYEGVKFEGGDDLAYPLSDWDDVYFANATNVDAGTEFIRMIAFADIGDSDNPHFDSEGSRNHIFNLVFSIDQSTPVPQEGIYVSIDTTYDPINKSMLFGLYDAVTEFTPAFVSADIEFIVSGISDGEVLPTKIALSQNYPNPFNPQTSIQFDLPINQMITLNIYNILGQNVKTLASGTFEAGTHTLLWDGNNSDGNNVPSGVYFYNLTAGDFSQTNKMILIR